jgi:hypothetical protein
MRNTQVGVRNQGFENSETWIFRPFTRAQTEFGHALAPQTLFGRLAETEFPDKYVPKLEFGNEAGKTKFLFAPVTFREIGAFEQLKRALTLRNL